MAETVNNGEMNFAEVENTEKVSIISHRRIYL